MRAYSPGGILIALAPRQKGLKPPTSSIHRLRHGLPGYLILFDPHAFELSVSNITESRLHHRCSTTYLRISPLHVVFRFPLISSSSTVSKAVSGLSPETSLPTCQAAYAPFTPSQSDQRFQPPYYRSCWHGVSRWLFFRYGQISHVLSGISSSLTKEVYNPKTFILHAALLLQACAH